MTRDLYSLGGDVGFWTAALDKFEANLQKRSPVGQTLLWMDVGNTWADPKIAKPKTKDAQILGDRKLAYRLSLYFDRVLYVTIGKGIPLTMCGGTIMTLVSGRITRISFTQFLNSFPISCSWTSIGET